MINIKKSFGSWLYCGKRQLLDFHGGYGSNPLGWNHPKLIEKLSSIDISYIANKPANSDFQTEYYRSFIKNFKTILPSDYHDLFLIDGGALAVENAIKVAMDWKFQKLKENGNIHRYNLKILHFENAFHGRSGYTMSLTNTDPHKIKRFTKFEWPRILHGEEQYMLNQTENKIKYDSEIAAVILEPIQCEGGDHYFSKDFLLKLQKLCNIYDVLFILDEVQTGFFTTGKPWCFQHYDLQPDIVSFGKKSQQCGIFANNKITKLEDNCFDTPGRINSTWGGNLIDMIRSNIILDIIKEDNLEQNVLERGNQWNNEMNNLNTNKISNIRNLGLIMAFDCHDRDKTIKKLEDEGLLTLSCGKNTIRLRPNLAVSEKDVEICMGKIEKVLNE